METGNWKMGNRKAKREDQNKKLEIRKSKSVSRKSKSVSRKSKSENRKSKLEIVADLRISIFDFLRRRALGREFTFCHSETTVAKTTNGSGRMWTLPPRLAHRAQALSLRK
jgi:hypothetical protein